MSGEGEGFGRETFNRLKFWHRKAAEGRGPASALRASLSQAVVLAQDSSQGFMRQPSRRRPVDAHHRLGPRLLVLLIWAL